MYIDKSIYASVLLINTCPYLASTDSIWNSTKAIRLFILEIFRIFETTEIPKLFDENENLNTTVHFTLKNATYDGNLHRLFIHEHQFPSLNIHCNFSNSNMHVTIKKFTIFINGTVQNHEKSSKSHHNFTWMVTSKDILIKIGQLSTNLSDEKLPINVSFTKSFQGFSYEIYNESAHSCKLETKKQNQMEKSLAPVMLSVVRDYFMARVKKLLKLFLKQNLRTNYFSKCSNILKSQHQYNYFIPNVSTIWFNLTNITIGGLMNFKSFNAVVKQDNSFVGTLLMKNIRGKMILDYGSFIDTPIKLDFAASFVQILIKRNDSRVYVEAQNYRITRHGLNTSLTNRRSAIVMQRIEYAIALSIMPSMNVFWREHQLSRIYGTESPFEKTDWNTMAELFNKSIPFDNDRLTEVTTIIPSGIEQKLQEFEISFYNMTVKLILGVHYPKQIQCEFLDRLKVIHEMKAIPTDNINLHSNGDIIGIHFHSNFTSINFSTVASNNSRINNTCEVHNIPRSTHPNTQKKVSC